MQLPFAIEVELPAIPGLSHLAQIWWIWLLGGVLVATMIGALVLVQQSTRLESATASATLLVTSSPPGAEVVVDGHPRGRTPATLALPPGEHEVRLRHTDYAEVTYHVRLTEGESINVDGALWLRTPLVQRLRPTFPGASIVDASFLANGRVALAVTIPPDEERQLWLVDAEGGIQRVGPPEARGSLVVSPDGARIAYLAQRKASSIGNGRLDEVWLGPTGGERGERRYALPSTSTAERLVDLSWAPAGDGLLVVSRTQAGSGAVRTRLLWLETTGGEPTELATLPSEVVPGSYSWSPDGVRVAFLTRAGSLTSLCLVSRDGAEFRYLADLGREDTHPLSFPPIAWSRDGARVVYTAPTQDRPNTGGFLFGPKASLALFAVELPRSSALRLGASEGQSPTWRPDGSLLALGRARGNGPLTLRAFDEKGGNARDLGEIPVRPATVYLARWDVAHAQMLLALRGSASLGATSAEYWLVRYQPEA